MKQEKVWILHKRIVRIFFEAKGKQILTTYFNAN